MPELDTPLSENPDVKLTFLPRHPTDGYLVAIWKYNGGWRGELIYSGYNEHRYAATLEDLANLRFKSPPLERIHFTDVMLVATATRDTQQEVLEALQAALDEKLARFNDTKEKIKIRHWRFVKKHNAELRNLGENEDEPKNYPVRYSPMRGTSTHCYRCKHGPIQPPFTYTCILCGGLVCPNCAACLCGYSGPRRY